MKKIRTMCKIKPKNLNELEDEFLRQVSKPKYYCRKCLRVATKKSNLCKPKKL